MRSSVTVDTCGKASEIALETLSDSRILLLRPLVILKRKPTV
jgi:hypothetical protein